MTKKLYMYDYNGKSIIVNDRKLRGLAPPPPANGYLNILILGDGYVDSTISRLFFYHTREAIIQELHNTAPFNAFWPFINIFSRFEASNEMKVGVNGPSDTIFKVEAYHWGSNDPNWHNRRVEINPMHLITVYNYIKDLSFTGFGLSITGEDEWLTPGKKSFGFIGFIGHADDANTERYIGGSQYSTIEVQPNKYLSYFAVVGEHDDDIAHTFVHELGHAFGLADEYDEDEKEKIDPVTSLCVNPLYLCHPRRPVGGVLDITPLPEPNVLLRHELLPPAEQLSDDRTKPLDADKMILTGNKWYSLMTTDDINWHTSPSNKYLEHPSWDPTHNDCRFDYELDSSGNEIATQHNWVFDPDRIIISEGAMRYRRDVYRPNMTCYMRNLTPEPDITDPNKRIKSQFCKVCRLHIIKAIMEKEHWSLGK